MRKSPLTILAACVDVRSGRRFEPGDVFDPAPTVEQAKRLVRAGCLDEAAIEAAKDVEEREDVSQVERDISLSPLSPDPSALDQRTDEGEATARAADEAATSRVATPKSAKVSK